ncbi:hypothetical protein MASR2M70_19420 [Bacillota bacterium]
MPIDSISQYLQTSSTDQSKKSSSNALGIDDFFKLMVAQLSNQDMFNTVDDTQFIAQMAQFSMVQALSDLSQASATAYSVSLIGKEATVATSGADGQIKIYSGIVEGVSLYGGTPQITIDGEKYALSSVMEVKEAKIIIPQNNLKEQEAEPAENKDNEGGTD